MGQFSCFSPAAIVWHLASFTGGDMDVAHALAEQSMVVVVTVVVTVVEVPPAAVTVVPV
jgi:hypothetical protein